MKFTLTLVNSVLRAGDENIPKYEALGFEVVSTPGGVEPWECGQKVWLLDDNDSVELEIYTLEELLAFVDEYGAIVIEADHSIEIYNGYRE